MEEEKSTKKKLAELLEDQNGEFLSGNVIAQSLGITRAAIWKNIRLLETEGYQIEAVQNRGYRLSPDNDTVSAHVIRGLLGEYKDMCPIEVYRTVDSTNDILKERAAVLPGWFTVIAGCQNAGRGRRGRSFYSPEGTGVYLSVLIKLSLPAQEATRITTAAAVAACRAIEECTREVPSIKWVNDVFLNGKKTCGILTEASVSMESGGLDWAVMGIGFNVYEPEQGFPSEIAQIAGAIAKERWGNLRNRIAAAFIRHFYQVCSDLMSPLLAKEYKERSFLIGKEVDVIRGEDRIPAVAEDIDDACQLIVRYADGRRETLSSGEVSVRAV